MEARTKSKQRLAPLNSFEVTCSIGTVSIDGNGTHTPTVCAYMLIAEHDAPGEFHFPLPDGAECVVNVEHRRES